ELTYDVAQNLADYVESLSYIMMELDNVTREQLMCLQYLTVLLIENYPKLLPAFQIIACQTLSTALYNLMQVHGTVLDNFLASIGK
ncbi:hypothetical protein L9F63_015222, partial [Diploptera punctata]